MIPWMTRLPVPGLLRLGEEATGAGYADLAARAWVLAAELLEARPHADRQREQVWAEAEQALGRLPEAHPLRRTLQRDLAYLRLTHARHVTDVGACTGGGTASRSPSIPSSPSSSSC